MVANGLAVDSFAPTVDSEKSRWHLDPPKAERGWTRERPSEGFRAAVAFASNAFLITSIRPLLSDAR